ncbi:NAD(P)-dependent oxidoreductase [Stigmatella aurantiaca]|uniref:3-hydroxyisobutyrate dehydrogenase family protein n=1 Tax=Stigmatella aurantiaca (strain DW4/3-1) TaxID=378806 RepID=Q08S14_STIAD|nr:NAD(P)-dependent oxidoreductase [Stigmatella aurantiaca]ADO72682.1 3-hydroxyisobutyrate dehydrogenase family protein [Stigmatella aurantiaca DW4/3-1]EAU63268.1 6-phosphogluconate dehydrogenase, NAD-binding [Stigmatella aurantiaca DW4/3-1]
MKVGLIGLGNMGRGVAQNLLNAGHELVVYNRTRAKAEPFQAKGARIAGTPQEAARGAEAVFSILADDPALEAAVFGGEGLLSGLARGAIHISSSTISVALSERLAAEHAQAGQGYVSAPVFGRPEAAEAKQLWVLAAGAKADVERVRPLLEAIGRGLTVLGEKASSANVVKLSGNFLIASMVEALGEAFALAQKSGVEPKTFLEVFQSVFAKSPIFERYASLIAGRQFQPPGFALRLGLKDIGLVLEAAGDAQVPMPLASLVKDHLLGGVAQGHGELDWSALGALAAERAGLEKL